jgi:hypothetical protein
LGGIWRVVRPLLWNGNKTLGQETLLTGGRIFTDIADKTPFTSTRDIVSRQKYEFTEKLVKKLRGGGRKRKMASHAGPAKKQKKPAMVVKGILKRDIFS